eukprot:CAMPEP_0176020756 /NCGR_PEP_ID=MMETSP0120_2-20121206/10063_1 /TAXON_ID=160619 /ORGANISM="Kryptoperidinium foliaceum, Strain CCMP 1326" /LENGTH=95 /DNA_ID=CAMNT_0017353859 /DNA_START=222 /DNA_END=506 /DNA_ORIENTATION=-
MSGNQMEGANETGPEEGENALTNCLLSQYRFCAAGVGLGTAYALKYKKGIIPMVAAGAIGTSADMLYGLFVECAHLRNQDTHLPSVSPPPRPSSQ